MVVAGRSARQPLSSPWRPRFRRRRHRLERDSAPGFGVRRRLQPIHFLMQLHHFVVGLEVHLVIHIRANPIAISLLGLADQHEQRDKKRLDRDDQVRERHNSADRRTVGHNISSSARFTRRPTRRKEKYCPVQTICVAVEPSDRSGGHLPAAFGFPPRLR